MAEFLSDNWFDALIKRAGDVAVDPAIAMILQQTVEADSTVVWHMVIADGTIRVSRGEASEADVRLLTDLATATGIHDGTISAQRAFLDGDLQIGGDLHALMAARDSLADLSLFTD